MTSSTDSSKNQSMVLMFSIWHFARALRGTGAGRWVFTPTAAMCRKHLPAEFVGLNKRAAAALCYCGSVVGSFMQIVLIRRAGSRQEVRKRAGSRLLTLAVVMGMNTAALSRNQRCGCSLTSKTTHHRKKPPRIRCCAETWCFRIAVNKGLPVLICTYTVALFISFSTWRTRE